MGWRVTAAAVARDPCIRPGIHAHTVRFMVLTQRKPSTAAVVNELKLKILFRDRCWNGGPSEGTPRNSIVDPASYLVHELSEFLKVVALLPQARELRHYYELRPFQRRHSHESATQPVVFGVATGSAGRTLQSPPPPSGNPLDDRTVNR